MGTTNFGDVALDDASIASVSSMLNDLNELRAARPGGGVFGTPGTETGEAVTTHLQVNDYDGSAMARRSVVDVMISTDANGDTPGDGSLTLAFSAGTDGALIGAAGSKATYITEADGDLDIRLTDSAGATGTVRIHLIIDGVIVATSAAVTFAA